MTRSKSRRSSCISRRSADAMPALFTITCRPPNARRRGRPRPARCRGPKRRCARTRRSSPSAAARLFAGVVIDICDDDLGTLLHEHLRRGAADAVGAAGDDRDLPFQFVTHGDAPRRGSRVRSIRADPMLTGQRLSPDLDRIGHEREGRRAGGAAAAARRACRPERTRRSTPSPLRREGSRRRRTPASRPSCLRGAAPSVRARSAGTTSLRTARGRRSQRAACCSNPVGDRLVEVADQDLLVVEREVGERAGLETELGAVERAGVLERVLLDRDRRVLLGQPLARRSSAARTTGRPRTHACCATSARTDS